MAISIPMALACSTRTCSAGPKQAADCGECSWTFLPLMGVLHQDAVLQQRRPKLASSSECQLFLNSWQ
eukprot:1839385-Amphidinium_carterae.1